MNKLLAIEWMKIKGYKTFWVLAILFLVSIFGINYFWYYVKEATVSDNAMANAVLGTPFSFPNVWVTVSFISSFVLFLPGLMIITSVANEFVFRTHRQNIIDGWSRLQFIQIKMVLIVILSVFSTVVVFLTALFLGSLSKGNFSLDKIHFLGYYFIQALSYGMVALLLSVLIKRSGLAIGVFFIYIFIIENVLGAFLNYLTKDANTFNGLGELLPLNSIDNLIPFPFLDGMKVFAPKNSLPVLLIAGACYLFLYYYFSRRKFLKDDL